MYNPMYRYRQTAIVTFKQSELYEQAPYTVTMFSQQT